MKSTAALTTQRLGGFLWLRAHRLHVLGPLGVLAAVAAVATDRSYLPLPTMFGVLLPVVSSAIAATAFAAFAAHALRPLPIERVAVRPLAPLDIATISAMCLPAIALTPFINASGIGLRCLVGMTGLALLASALPAPWSSLTPVTYFALAATLGRAGTDPFQAQPWAWLVDGTHAPHNWYIAIALCTAGVLSRLYRNLRPSRGSSP